MSRFAFWRPQLEDHFAFQLAERTRASAALSYSVASALSLAALVRCCMAAAAASLTPPPGRADTGSPCIAGCQCACPSHHRTAFPGTLLPTSLHVNTVCRDQLSRHQAIQ